MCDDNSIERHTHDDELAPLPIVTLPNGTRFIALIEPVRPYLVVVRGAPDARHQGEADVAKSPAKGELSLITADTPRTRRTAD